MYQGSFGKEIVNKWQAMLNLLAEVFAMPAALIICERPQGYEVLVANENPGHPFQRGTALTGNLNSFCTQVLVDNQPEVPANQINASAICTKPDAIAKGFNTSVGLPLHCPDGSAFGVICVMHQQTLPVNASHFHLLDHFKRITELDLRLLDRLQSATELSLKDDLTGVYNRRGFNVLSQKQFFYGKRSHIKFAFMIADIDRLKYINDNFGHKTGDHAVVTMADALTSSFRECDLVARIGGDEFYIALNLNRDDEIATIVARAEDYLNKHPVASGIVTFSWGVSIRHYSNAITLSLEELIDEADSKLYENKKLNSQKNLQNNPQA